MIVQGLTISAVGMTIVFGFLVLLVVVLKLISHVLQAYFPQILEYETAGPGKGVSIGDNVKIAIAVAAVEAFKAGGKGMVR